MYTMTCLRSLYMPNVSNETRIGLKLVKHLISFICIKVVNTITCKQLSNYIKTLIYQHIQSLLLSKLLSLEIINFNCVCIAQDKVETD